MNHIHALLVKAQAIRATIKDAYDLIEVPKVECTCMSPGTYPPCWNCANPPDEDVCKTNLGDSGAYIDEIIKYLEATNLLLK